METLAYTGYNFPLVWTFRHVCFWGYRDLTKPSINGKLCLVYQLKVLKIDSKRKLSSNPP